MFLEEPGGKTTIITVRHERRSPQRMTLHFFAPLRNIDVTESGPSQISGGLFLTREVDAALKTLPPEFSRLVGIISYGAYQAAPACVWGAWTGHTITAEVDAEAVVTSMLSAIQGYLMALWYVRDHCVMCDGGVLLYSEESESRTGWHGVTHSLGQYFWNATVQHTTTSFDAHDLASAAALADRAKSVFEVESAPLSTHPTLPKGVSRLMRGLYYLENARSCSDIEVRIATYISCLESLVSTDSAELAHKLSERIAVLLTDNCEERLSLYEDLKRAYTVRSKIVHGDEIDSRLQGQLLKMSIRCDELLRRAFVKILSDDSAAAAPRKQTGDGRVVSEDNARRRKLTVVIRAKPNIAVPAQGWPTFVEVTACQIRSTKQA